MLHHPLHIVMLREVRDHELFEIRGAPHHCASPVQPDPSSSRAPPSRCDRCYTPSFLVHAAHFIVLRHDPATQSFRRFVGVSSNVHHLAHVLAAFNSYFHFTKYSIVSHLTADTRLALTSETEWSPRQDHQPARTWLRTDVTPRLHLLEGLLDVSNACDRRLSRTLPAAFV